MIKIENPANRKPWQGMREEEEAICAGIDIK